MLLWLLFSLGWYAFAWNPQVTASYFPILHCSWRESWFILRLFNNSIKTLHKRINAIKLVEINATSKKSTNKRKKCKHIGIHLFHAEQLLRKHCSVTAWRCWNLMKRCQRQQTSIILFDSNEIICVWFHTKKGQQSLTVYSGWFILRVFTATRRFTFWVRNNNPFYLSFIQFNATNHSYRFSWICRELYWKFCCIKSQPNIRDGNTFNDWI